MCLNVKRVCFNLALNFLVLSPNLAFAYIDPGTGSMVVQALLAGLAAVAVSIGIFWRRIRSFFTGIFSREDNEKLQ